MRKIVRAQVYHGDNQYAAECFDLPAVTQAATLDELMLNLRAAMDLQLEGENPADMGLAPNASILVTYEMQAAFAS